MTSKRRRTIVIETEGGRKTVSVAWAKSGLAVHRARLPRPGGKRVWNVTHIPSGRLVLRCGTKRGAIRLVRTISKWANWKQEAETLVRDWRLGQQIKDLSRESKDSTWSYL